MGVRYRNLLLPASGAKTIRNRTPRTGTFVRAGASHASLKLRQLALAGCLPPGQNAPDGQIRTPKCLKERLPTMNSLVSASQNPAARIGFLSLDDSARPNLLSGGFYGMREGFKQIGCEVVDIFPVRPRTRLRWILKKILHRLGGRYYHWDREPEFLREVSAIAGAWITEANPDLVIAVQSQACTHLEANVPILLTHDQTFIELQDYFPFEPRPRTREYVRQAIDQEGLAFAAADLIAYPSRTSCETVKSAYGIASEKLLMVPWGGNLSRAPTRAEVDAMIEARRKGPTMLTAIGVNWERKGGDLVVEAYRALRKQGLDVALTIIGMTPPFAVDDRTRLIPFLDKTDPGQAPVFEEIMAATHFLVAPSRVEAFGHIFGEAAAFGIPAIASDVGGIPTSVEDRVNGRLLSLDATGDNYAEAILECLSSTETYETMAHRSRQRFEEDLNWPAFCRTIVDECLALKKRELACPTPSRSQR